ncbi:CNH domain-containing protein [Crassisporium funariophilum]|nr:CNH domain-containing protein [Crassisporium funariophilum]
MSTVPHPPTLIVPGEDALNDLYDKVLRGFSSPTSPESPYSPYSQGNFPETGTGYSNSIKEESSSLHRTSSYTPSPLSRTPSVSQPEASAPTVPRRRPLPPTPGAPPPPRLNGHITATSIPPIPTAEPPPAPAPVIPAPPPIPQASSSRAGPSSSSSSTNLSRSVSRKISRRYSRHRPQFVSQDSAEVIDESSAGPSGTNEPEWDPSDEVPTSPSTEFPDSFGAYLPGYYNSVHDDPNASASLGYGPPADGVVRDYTEPPPPELYEESVASERPPQLIRYQSTASNSSRAQYWGSSADVSTFMSGDYPMLRPPSNSSSEFRLPYLDPAIEESELMHDTHDWSSNLVQIKATPKAPPNRTLTGNSFDTENTDDWAAGPSDLNRRNTNVIELIKNFDQRTHLELHEEEEEDIFDDDERRFINLSLLSNLAVQLRDKVPRGTHVKGSVPYPRAFTGKDVVSTIQSIIQRELVRDHGGSTTDRRAALLVARSLQNMLFFYEVEWGARVLQDGVEDVYMFLDDQEGGSDVIERAELPTGVVTILTKCYSASCDDGCYAYGCPRKGIQQLPSTIETPAGAGREEWPKIVPPDILASLTESEINRQTIIHKLISKEEQYIEDLNIVESVFIKPLRSADPPVMTPLILQEFIDEVFGNILELRECNRRLLEVMYVRQREQSPIIQSVGDIFLDAATEFRIVYPIYVGHHPLAEKRMKEELEHNPEFRLFIEKCSRQLAARPGGSPRLDLKHYLNRPAEHLQKYPVLLDAVYRETEQSNPDGDYLSEAIAAIENLQNVAQLRTFQSAMGKGSTGKWEWHDLVSSDTRMSFTKEESKRQSVIFELIKGEMAYVRDLENIETMYVRPLRNAEPPIVPTKRLEQFLIDVFHNSQELYAHHRRLVDILHDIQREEHPRIRSITAAVFDSALNFREAYMEYIPNYPIAAYRIDDEMANNPAFKAFVNHTIRHPDAHRLDMKNFINRPIPRLLRYELLLKEILSETPTYHEDRSAIPPVIELIKALGRETEPGVMSSKQKVELWRYNSNLVFKSGEHVDMDLLNEQRSLIHTGKLLRQPESGLEWNGWGELFIMLFDNYFVMTKPREKDGVTKYHVYRRPIPLDLLSLVNFTDTSIQRSTSILRTLRNNNQQSDTASISSRAADNADARAVFPFTIHHNGRLGGPYILYAETAASRMDWRQRLEEALGLRKVVQESNKVFEIESLSVDTFLVPSLTTGPNSPAWHDGTLFTGKVTCSVPFNTPDGRGLVAIGCAEGVWIGYRHDSRSLRRVLHLKMVTQCAMLEDFGLFLVLADKVLFAYHLEALVPTIPGSVHASQTPQKINGKDVHFFSVGVLHGRTLVIYMKKRGNGDSVFHAVEPVIDKINERPKASGGLLPSLRKGKTDWFRQYKEFSFPEAYDLIFLKARLAVLCAKGFMIMDIIDYKSVTIPQRDDPNFPYLPKRCDSCRPLGMFRSSDEEFLLCYDEFGLFVDKQGNPSRPTGTIEWEGTADRVAMHAPYVLLFDTRFIEIRHVETGRLVQIIPGNDIRCVWDGRSLDGGAAVVAAEGTEENMVHEPRVHAVMNAVEPPLQPGGRPMRGIMQHVFELFPTIPLYLPGSLASPSTTTYFPMSFSPPRSPALRSHHM